MFTLEEVLVHLESLERGSADSAMLVETVAAGGGGVQKTVWVCPGSGEEGFCVRTPKAQPWVSATIGRWT